MAGPSRPRQESARRTTGSLILDPMAIRMPALFVAHGAPTLAIDDRSGADFKRWGQSLPRPKGILVFSAHWETSRFAFGETKNHDQLLYDFGGFSPELYRVVYPAPGAPWLADAVESLLDLPLDIERSERGLDHGVWVPFVHMWPRADIPVLQMTMPRTQSNVDLANLGERLAPLRDEGILIVGSGTLTHNLGEWRPARQGAPAEWAVEFDAWVAEALNSRNRDALLNWEQRAPQTLRNHPTPEHFRPLLVAWGAAKEDEIAYPVTGMEFGIFSRRSIQFG